MSTLNVFPSNEFMQMKLDSVGIAIVKLGLRALAYCEFKYGLTKSLTYSELNLTH